MKRLTESVKIKFYANRILKPNRTDNSKQNIFKELSAA